MKKCKQQTQWESGLRVEARQCQPKTRIHFAFFCIISSTRDRPETARKSARDYPFPFSMASPSPCRLQLKLENLCTNSLKQECLCVLYVLVSVPHMPSPSLPTLSLSPNSASPSPSAVVFILSFCEHLACSFGFFGQLSGRHAQQSVMKFLGF